MLMSFGATVNNVRASDVSMGLMTCRVIVCILWIVCCFCLVGDRALYIMCVLQF